MIAESSATDAATTEARVVLLVWWGSVVPYKNHMIWARTRALMYLASSWTTFEQDQSFLYSYLLRVEIGFYGCFTGSFTSFTDDIRAFRQKFLYRHRIQLFLLCVLAFEIVR